jgi:hypothetical protein
MTQHHCDLKVPAGHAMTQLLQYGMMRACCCWCCCKSGAGNHLPPSAAAAVNGSCGLSHTAENGRCGQHLLTVADVLIEPFFDICF